MAYVTPPSFVSGTTAVAADANILGADIEYLYGIVSGLTASGVQATRTTNQSISGSTWTAISFGAEQFDLGSWWSSGTDVVVPAGAIAAGSTTALVIVSARLQFLANSTGRRGLKILKNGTQTGRTTVDAEGGGDTTDMLAFDAFLVEAGDVITLEAYQSSGGSLNVGTASLTVIRLFPAD